MTATGTLSGYAMTRGGKPLVSMELNAAALGEWYDENAGKLLEISIKQHRAKRSLEANRLCWKLCTEIADMLRMSKEEIYLRMLREYGQSALISVSSAVPEQKIRTMFKYYDIVSADSQDIQIIVYIGSSDYDTREMSVLLDGITEEARQLGIPVLTARELDLIKSDWKG